MAKQPENRPQKIADVLQALNAIAPLNAHSLPAPLPVPTNLSTSDAIAPAPAKNIKGAKTLLGLGSQLPLAVEQVCWKALWPKDKPTKEIVFPSLIYNRQEVVAALWLMMPKQEIASRGVSMRYNEFIFASSPHPMVLWITVLYSRELGPKWLPCYLDIQNPQTKEIWRSLAENDRYPLLFFTLEKPHSCANVMSSRIAPTQRQMFKTWAASCSQSAPSPGMANLSKNLLKQQYQQVKPRILRQLESMHQETSINGDYTQTVIRQTTVDPWRWEKT